MMGKVLGVGAVGFTQLLIWFVLIGGLSTVGLSILAGDGAIMEAASQQVPQEAMELTSQQEMAANIQAMIATVPVVKILLCFLFYFVGAYLLYGAFMLRLVRLLTAFKMRSSLCSLLSFQLLHRLWPCSLC